MALEKIVHIPDPGVSREGELGRLRLSVNRSKHKFVVIQGESGLTLLIGPIATAKIHQHCAHEHILKRAAMMGYAGRPLGGGMLTWTEESLRFGGRSQDYGSFNYELLGETDWEKVREELGRRTLIFGEEE